jgi:hypothetical protein
VVRVATAHAVDVEVHLQLVHEREQEVVHERGVEGADALAPRIEFVDEVGPAAQVDHDRNQRLVERNRGLAEATDSRLRPERVAEGLPERQAEQEERLDNALGEVQEGLLAWASGASAEEPPVLLTRVLGGRF